jgi:hypothetical protein
LAAVSTPMLVALRVGLHELENLVVQFYFAGVDELDGPGAVAKAADEGPALPNASTRRAAPLFDVRPSAA